ncbi:hypothetical protein NPX79_01100 [Spiroplasma endosymbiont of Anurida maritima]|uniref:hypothetical protein n=1 Tax=Spiroplasma endosymbiont of Anurida maritima TaxID=2967972 RepID=UPI0036D425AA
MKIKSKTLKIIFISTLSVFVSLSLGLVLFYIFSPSNLKVSDPFKNANKFDAEFIENIHEDYFKNDNPESFEKFYIANSDSRESFVSESESIDSKLNNVDFIKKNQNYYAKMFEGTPGTFENANYFNMNGKQYKFKLVPIILEFPYQDGQNKKGIVKFNKKIGENQWFYEVKYAVKLVGFRKGKAFDLNKTYELNLNSNFFGDFLSLSSMIFLSKNDVLKKFTNSTSLAFNDTDSNLKMKMLNYFFNLSNIQNENLRFDQQIDASKYSGIVDEPSNIANSSLNDDVLHLLFDNRQINLNNLGANIFSNNNVNGYQTAKYLLNKFGGNNAVAITNETTFKNIENGQNVTQSEINNYKGYISELGVEHDADWYSRHTIFKNNLNVSFLGQSNIVKTYYDQITYKGISVAFDNLNINNAFQQAVNKITYDSSGGDVNNLLLSETNNVKAFTENYFINNIKDQDIKNSVINNRLITEISIDIQGGVTRSDFEPVNGANRGNKDKVFVDRNFSMPLVAININVKTNDGPKSISGSFWLEDVRRNDNNGVDKYDLDVLKRYISISDMETRDSKSYLNSRILYAIEQAENAWASSLLDPRFVLENSANNAFSINIIEPSGRNNNNNLKLGTYGVSVASNSSSLNYKGQFTINNLLNVDKTPMNNFYFSTEKEFTTENNTNDVQRYIVNDLNNVLKGEGINFSINDVNIDFNNDGSKLELGEYQIYVSAKNTGDNFIKGQIKYIISINT